ncbi:hypothetical protein DOY81_009432 [Sarcophaga bullata]|nr:hypothetical protein DOY81_009432 [Sarcophaga bullata]
MFHACACYEISGVRFLMATNAAGGLNPKYKVGDIMIVENHINMMDLLAIHRYKDPMIPVLVHVSHPWQMPMMLIS